jgi:chromosome segregation ATPase
MGTIEQSVEKTIEKMQGQLAQWGAKIDELARKATNAGTEAKADYRKRLDELKAKRAEAQSKLDAVKGTGSAKWEGFKDGIEHAFKDLAGAFKDLTHTEKQPRS